MFVVQIVQMLFVGDCGGGDFNAASFVGGIILSVSVTLIGYFGFRYWQTHKRRTAWHACQGETFVFIHSRRILMFVFLVLLIVHYRVFCLVFLFLQWLAIIQWPLCL